MPGAALCRIHNETSLIGRGGKLTRVSQAQMPLQAWQRAAGYCPAVGTPEAWAAPLSKGTASPPQFQLEVSSWKLGLRSAWSSIFAKETGNTDF